MILIECFKIPPVRDRTKNGSLNSLFGSTDNKVGHTGPSLSLRELPLRDPHKHVTPLLWDLIWYRSRNRIHWYPIQEDATNTKEDATDLISTQEQ